MNLKIKTLTLLLGVILFCSSVFTYPNDYNSTAHCRYVYTLSAHLGAYIWSHSDGVNNSSGIIVYYRGKLYSIEVPGFSFC
jgi:hypothetical protein